jgi:hypothetical protein
MNWKNGDLISGERLQAVAEATVVTKSILKFHRSLRQAGIGYCLLFPGTHTELDPDPASIAALRGRRSIFVYSHLLPSFIFSVLPRLDHRFVLISHNSDDGVDARFLKTLDDPRIVHWFAQNVSIDHPKLTPLPIGIANAQWPHGQVADFIAAAAAAPSSKQDVIYCNFGVGTNPTRISIHKRVAASGAISMAPGKPFRRYLADLAQCRWCLSPPGGGLDCHRTWEALYLGVVPIVARTAQGAALYDGLPVIRIEDLGGLSLGSIKEEQAKLEAQTFEPVRLTMAHWRQRIAEKVAEAG